MVKISPSYSSLSVEKSDSPEYDTRGDLLADGVSYPGESCFGELFIDLQGYDTPGSQIFELKIRITRELLTEIENIFIRWSVAQ